MVDEIRMTLQTQLVLRAFVNTPREEHYGFELAKESGLPTGSIYPILARLEAAGWIKSDWEMINESSEGRRRRRYYTMTAAGLRSARAALEKTRRQMFPELAGGRA